MIARRCVGPSLLAAFVGLAAVFGAPGAGAIEPLPAQRAQREAALAGAQARERVDLWRALAHAAGRDVGAESPQAAARARARHTVERLRQQARHEEQRYRFGLERRSILPRPDGSGGR